MRPMGAFELARAEHQRADARADREHRQLQTEEGSSPMDFMVAVMDTSKDVKLILNTMNTASNGSTPA